MKMSLSRCIAETLMDTWNRHNRQVAILERISEECQYCCVKWKCFKEYLLLSPNECLILNLLKNSIMSKLFTLSVS